MSKQKELLKKILAGKVSSDALNPPKFKKELLGREIVFTIDGKKVDHAHYLAERERLGVSPLDDEFIIHHRAESEGG